MIFTSADPLFVHGCMTPASRKSNTAENQTHQPLINWLCLLWCLHTALSESRRFLSIQKSDFSKVTNASNWSTNVWSWNHRTPDQGSLFALTEMKQTVCNTIYFAYHTWHHLPDISYERESEKCHSSTLEQPWSGFLLRYGIISCRCINRTNWGTS